MGVVFIQGECDQMTRQRGNKKMRSMASKPDKERSGDRKKLMTREKVAKSMDMNSKELVE